MSNKQQKCTCIYQREKCGCGFGEEIQQQKFLTAEEILKKHRENETCGYVLLAMKDFADQQTSQLQQEKEELKIQNKELKEQFAVLFCFYTRAIKLQESEHQKLLSEIPETIKYLKAEKNKLFISLTK